MMMFDNSIYNSHHESSLKPFSEADYLPCSCYTQRLYVCYLLANVFEPNHATSCNIFHQAVRVLFVSIFQNALL